MKSKSFANVLFIFFSTDKKKNTKTIMTIYLYLLIFIDFLLMLVLLLLDKYGLKWSFGGKLLNM